MSDTAPQNKSNRSPEAQEKLRRDLATFEHFIDYYTQEMLKGRALALIVSVVEPCDRTGVWVKSPKGQPDPPQQAMLLSTLPCPNSDVDDY